MGRAACIQDLPSPLLGRVFDRVGVPGALAVLLVCKHWCRVANEECPKLWSVGQIEGNKIALAISRGGVMAKKSFLRGFHHKACHLHQLHLSSGDNTFTALVPGLLKVAGHAPLLELLQVEMRMSKQHWRAALQAISGLTRLTRLSLKADAALQTEVPLQHLACMSTLVQLRSLDVDIPLEPGLLDASVLGSMRRLTHLAFNPHSSWMPFPVGWAGGGSGGPRLLSLRLSACHLAPEECTLASLHQLEALELKAVGIREEFAALLPQLSSLTSLALDQCFMEDDDGEEEEEVLAELLSQAAGRCRQLRELRLHGVDLPATLQVGSLPLLTRLQLHDLPMQLLPPAWCQLPALRSLHYVGEHDFEMLPEFSRLQGLQELHIEGFEWNVVPGEIVALGALTRLVLKGEIWSPDLPVGPYLQHLRELVLGYPVDLDEDSVDMCEFLHVNGQRDRREQIPCALKGNASHLELLDLSGRYKVYRNEVAVLHSLPALARLVLPSVCGYGWGADEMAKVASYFREQLPAVAVEIDATGAFYR